MSNCNQENSGLGSIERPLDIDSIGKRTFIDGKHFDSILKKIGAELAPRVHRDAVCFEVNEICNRWLLARLQNERHSQETEDLIEAGRRYLKLSRRHAHSNNPPPVLNGETFEQWVEAAEAQRAKRKRGGGQHADETYWLYPRLIGLFAAAFEREPQARFSKKKGNPESAAYHFVVAVSDEIQRSLKKAELSPRIAGSVSLSVKPSEKSEDALRARFKKAMTLVHDSTEHGIAHVRWDEKSFRVPMQFSSHELAWATWARQFWIRIQRQEESAESTSETS